MPKKVKKKEGKRGRFAPNCSTHPLHLRLDCPPARVGCFTDTERGEGGGDADEEEGLCEVLAGAAPGGTRYDVSE